MYGRLVSTHLSEFLCRNECTIFDIEDFHKLSFSAPKDGSTLWNLSSISHETNNTLLKARYLPHDLLKTNSKYFQIPNTPSQILPCTFFLPFSDSWPYSGWRSGSGMSLERRWSSCPASSQLWWSSFSSTTSLPSLGWSVSTGSSSRTAVSTPPSNSSTTTSAKDHVRRFSVFSPQTCTVWKIFPWNVVWWKGFS